MYTIIALISGLLIGWKCRSIAAKQKSKERRLISKYKRRFNHL